jgi:predicted nucleic-acid-binding Zn-ribbon protein
MSERELMCPKCGQVMEPGFVLDRGPGGVAQESWVDGAPVPSNWTGLKVKAHQLVPVTTYRCTGCGYLESYASPASGGP